MNLAVQSSPRVESRLEPRLEIKGLRHAFGDRVVLDGVELSVGRGEIVGLLGPNGSGKSTLLAIVSGLLARQQGELTFEGRALGKPDASFRSRLGVVFQQPSVDRRLTARENLRLALQMHGLGGRGAVKQVDDMLAAAGLAERADEVLDKFSGGMRRRIDLVRAVAHGPSLLLMDEPSAGLDEASFRRLWTHVEQIRRDQQVSVVVATHRPDEAAFCDRLVVIDHGKVVASDTPEALIGSLADDTISIVAADAEELASFLSSQLGLDAVVPEPRQVLVHCERGHELIVQIVEAVPRGRIEAIGLRRPTLGDVFLRLTGHALDGEAIDGAGEGA